MGLKAKVKPELVVLSRIKVLYGVVEELARDLGAVAGSIEILRKGVLERQLLSRIWFYYLDAARESVCEVILSIDWDAHKVLASSDEGSTFSMDPHLSMAEQISGAFSVLMEHVKKVCDFHHVTEIKVFYGFRSAVCEDPQALAEARRFLGIGPGDTPKPAVGNSGFTEKMSAERLPELGVEINHS